MVDIQNYFNICSPDSCTACASCMNICAHNAITMQEDELGYQYPHINASLCVDCGLCRKICPALHPIDLQAPLEIFAAVAKNVHEHATCSSGGVASGICRYILKQGGVVYGCCQKNYLEITHVRVEKEEDLEPLKGSKYVQSNIGVCYRLVKKDLLDGKKVLFTGTPCQVAGLKQFLCKEYEQLYAIDLVCHGVAPQRLLREEVENCTEKMKVLKNEDQVFVKFRWKAKYGIQFGFQLWRKGRDMQLLDSKSFPYSPYITAFMTGLSFRENCHNCIYGNYRRIGDLTVGDFWGLGALEKTSIDARKGVSLLLVNTSKGKHLLEQVATNFVLEQRTLEEAVRGNVNLRQASVRPANKDLFKTVLKKKGLKCACHEALSYKQYARLVTIEAFKRMPFLVRIYKKGRFLANRYKSYDNGE